MKRSNKIIAAALSVLAVSVSCTQMEAPVPEVKDDSVPVFGIAADAVKGEILVKFRPEVSEILDEAGLTKAGDTPGSLTASGVPSFDEVLSLVGGYEIERVFPVDRANESRTRDNGLHLWYVVRFDASQDVEEVAARLSSLGELSKIQYNATVKKYSAKSTAADPQIVPGAVLSSDAAFNDPGLERQWHYINKGYFDANGDGQQDEGDEVLIGASGESTMIAGADVNVKDAWTKCKGDPSIVVAVMDEGVMWSHPDLAANIWVNEKEELTNTEDADGNGYVGDRYGYNFAHKSNVITWDESGDMSHGTHVAGTIGAVNNNSIGVCGIAGGDASTGEKGVRLMSLQIFAGNKGANILGNAQAIKYAADNGAVILQCSWGYISALANPMLYPQLGPRDDEEYIEYASLEAEAFDYFIHNAGSKDGVIDGGLVIFAGGNEEAAMPAYPAAYKDYICVAATSADYSPASYTNYGTGTDVCAPGGDKDYHMNELGSIYSTMTPGVTGGKGYGYMDGTSMACPHVSGVAALGLSYAVKQNKHYNSREFREMIIKAVEPVDDKYRNNFKYLYKSWSYGGTNLNKIPLNGFTGKMGAGAVDAARLFALIDGEEYGKKMSLTNVNVAVGKTESVELSRCFDQGTAAGASFTASSSAEGIAKVSVEGSVLKVTGVAKGMAKITVKCGGQTQESFAIVRKNADDNGII